MRVLGMLRCWVMLLRMVCWAHPVGVDYLSVCCVCLVCMCYGMRLCARYAAAHGCAGVL
ncbi:hypothetical protein L211DRAFT_838893, partial [Terfezia boudieri ATCC MYA-4762]